MSSNPTNSEILATSLSHGAQLFIFSLRQWFIAARDKQCLYSRLHPFYSRYRVETALPVLDELMCLLATAAFRPIAVHCPCRVDLGEDELMLLQTMQALHRDDHVKANEKLNQVLAGPFCKTFTRIALDYNAILKRADLRLTGMRYLQSVKS